MKSYSGHLHHVLNLYAWYHKPSSNGSLDFVDKVALLNKMSESEKGNNSAKYLQNFVKS